MTLRCEARRISEGNCRQHQRQISRKASWSNALPTGLPLTRRTSQARIGGYEGPNRAEGVSIQQNNSGEYRGYEAPNGIQGTVAIPHGALEVDNGPREDASDAER